MDAATRRMVRARAAARCEYCRIHEDDEPYSFHIEHIVAKKHDGDDHPDNLAWSCHSCNLFKGANLSGRVFDEVVALFHPRKQNWNRHFRWDDAVLVGKTKAGRATIQVLKINAKDRVDLRKVLFELGLLPPD